MLVLSRKLGEQIVIDENITLTVVEIRGDRIKLGFVGPSQVPIHRAEVFQRIEAARALEAKAWSADGNQRNGRACVLAN